MEELGELQRLHYASNRSYYEEVLEMSYPRITAKHRQELESIRKQPMKDGKNSS